MDKEKLIDDFVHHFILRDKRERCLFELNHPRKRDKFINRLNHDWAAIFDMRKLVSIPKHVKDNYNFIKAQLKIAGNDLCYAVSNYADLDGCEIPFEQVFDKSYGRGLATLLIVSADKIYLETEQEWGAPEGFVGKSPPSLSKTGR